MGQEIFYCDGCGNRILQKDIDQGRATALEHRRFCADCRANGLAVEPPGAPPAEEPPEPQEAEVPAGPSPRPGAGSPGPPAPSRGRTHRLTLGRGPAASSGRNVGIAVGVGGGILLLLVVLMAGGGGRGDRHDDPLPDPVRHVEEFAQKHPTEYEEIRSRINHVMEKTQTAEERQRLRRLLNETNERETTDQDRRRTAAEQALVLGQGTDNLAGDWPRYFQVYEGGQWDGQSLGELHGVGTAASLKPNLAVTRSAAFQDYVLTFDLNFRKGPLLLLPRLQGPKEASGTYTVPSIVIGPGGTLDLPEDVTYTLKLTVRGTTFDLETSVRKGSAEISTPRLTGQVPPGPGRIGFGVQGAADVSLQPIHLERLR